MADGFELTTPVLFIVFKRPDTTRRVFEAVRQARPNRLFVAADGPRPGCTKEADLCTEVRAIATAVDWDCDLKTLFRETNHGAGKGVSTAIDWFFKAVGEGIILEDDCLPHPSFFRFCQELLARYSDDTRVMHINGNNFASKQFIDTPYSYHFCSYPQAWGWATWKRAWQLFDPRLSNWPAIRAGRWLKAKCWSVREYRLQQVKFERMHTLSPRDIWDYAWHLSVFSQHGLAIVPKANLVSNIGFSEEATHTRRFLPEMAELKTACMQFPLVEPPFVVPDYLIDTTYRSMMIRGSVLVALAKNARRYLRWTSQ